MLRPAAAEGDLQDEPEVDTVGRGSDFPLLSATGIAKSYGATRALRHANLRLEPGEVHALLGENGAGKSTLVKIICGATRPDAGQLELRGRPLALGSVRDAVRLGIVPIYQHLSLMPHLSVAENLFVFEIARGASLGRPPGRAERGRAAEMLARVGLDIDPARIAGDLSLAERQLLEIARGVARDCAVLVLDEPTASLSRREAERLFAVMRGLCAAGRGVVFISHNLSEVEEVADRVSVLRDGSSVVEGAARAAISRREMVESMVGRPVDSAARLALPAPGSTLLEAEAVTVKGALRDASLRLRAGEILGVAGLIGSGARELGEALAGLRPAEGRLRVDGRPLALGRRMSALRRGIGLVPGEREADGVVPGRPVMENASAAALAAAGLGAWIRAGAERRRLLPWRGSLRVLPDDPGLPVDALSGGNQQKVLIARALAVPGLKALVALEPTRGVDIGARQIIHASLAAAARGGLGIIVVSSDLEELGAICHRLLVLRQGRIAAELPGECDQRDLLAALAGKAA